MSVLELLLHVVTIAAFAVAFVPIGIMVWALVQMVAIIS